MNDNDTTSVMYDHCVNVYNLMHKTATLKEEGEVRFLVWEGFFTRLIQNDLGLAVPYYTAIRAHLIRMGCVRQLRRGGGNAKSQWEVIKAPTKEAFENAEASTSAKARARETQSAQIGDLARRVTALERDQATLVRMVNSLIPTLQEEPPSTPTVTELPRPRREREAG